MDGQGGWTRPPCIVVEGGVPFYADHPSGYIEELERIHDEPTIKRGNFYTYIGQFKDALEQSWEVVDEKSHSGNGHRESLQRH